jgi:DUF1680 family protein
MKTRGAGPVDTGRSPNATWKTLGSRAVTIQGGLWAARQENNRQLALPHGLRMLEAAGNLANLRIAAGLATGRYRGPVFMDSDVYKWMEAAAFEMARVPGDEGLRSTIDATIELVRATQTADGYLDTHYQVAEPDRRWTDFAHGHELYCAGHLFQAAVAHHRATGDAGLLKIARRLADCIDGVFGTGRRTATTGHPEIEMGLVELYRETGERRYLDLVTFFVDQRGKGFLGPGRFNSSAYYQDRVPVREASEVEGHAVRATYLAAGVTDLYLETGDPALLAAVSRQWDDLVRHKLYVTGGLGARHHAESLGQPYELPSELAYSETCAAIGSIMWSWRMLLAIGEARFADLIERSLYNAVLGGVSLDGQRYFYVNPLASNGADEWVSRGGCRRKEWHLVACCPPNVMRLLASLGHYVATRDLSGLQVHQYVAAQIVTELGSGSTVALRMETGYPWEGRVRLVVEEGGGAPWTLALRVPGWCPETRVRLGDRELEATPDARGYLCLDRAWAPGDSVELELAMEPRLVEAHPWIESTRGRVAIERGPLVYCLEQADHPRAPVPDLEIDAAAPLTSRWEGDLLGGVAVVRASGFRVDTTSWRHQLYRPVLSGAAPARQRVELTAVPYFAWANRGPGAMRVWIPRGASF